MCKLLKLQVLTSRLQFVMHMLEEVALLSCSAATCPGWCWPRTP